jgi:hypothetical protein
MTIDREEAIIGMLYVLCGISLADHASSPSRTIDLATTGLRILGSNMTVDAGCTPIRAILHEAVDRFSEMAGPLP